MRAFSANPTGALDASGVSRESRRGDKARLPMACIDDASRIPVTVLTGLLGSGKTTLLNHVLKQPGMAATAVIVNEFGEIGLDHLLVEGTVNLASSDCWKGGWRGAC